ncbi:MFS transporter [Streptomyces sp. NPDC001787]|uniref:MFS transporter n=1 Tax=Streptomyces sp. NPDC001787 TaxID=3154523 RepID=UPI00331696F9
MSRVPLRDAATGPRTHRFLMPALIAGVVAFQLNASMVTPALPEIARELDAAASTVALSQNLFFLVGGVAGVVLSRLSDHLGRRLVLLASLAVMCAGTVLAMLAPNVELLVLGRVLQGASGATFQLTYLLLRESMSPKRFGTALGVITALNGGVGGVDGFLGGFVADRLGFRWIFGTILVTGLIALLCVARAVPGTPPAKDAGRMDWWGAASLSAAIVCVNQAISQGAAHGWGSLWPPVLAVVGAALFLAFWQIEKRGRTPLIAVRDLRSRQVWPLMATTLLTLVGVFAAMNFTVVLLSQDEKAGFGMSATLAALLFLTPPAAIGLLAAPVAGWLAPRKGWLPMLRTGLLASALALGVAAVFAGDRWAVLAVCCALGVFYNGLALTMLNGLGVVLSPKESPGALPGLNGACFGIGASVGIALVGPLAGAGTLGGYRTAFALAVVVTVLALLASMLIRQPAEESSAASAAPSTAPSVR